MLGVERNLNALLVVIIGGVLLGGFGVQILWREQPCPLCMLQRLAMLGVATSALLNVWFGVRMSHYALGLIFCVIGGFVALRQISLHVCPGSASYGLPVLGLSLYTWSFFVFVCSIVAIALLLFLYDPQKSNQEHPIINFWEKVAFMLIFATALGNIVSTLMICGLGPCVD